MNSVNETERNEGRSTVANSIYSVRSILMLPKREYRDGIKRKETILRQGWMDGLKFPW